MANYTSWQEVWLAVVEASDVLLSKREERRSLMLSVSAKTYLARRKVGGYVRERPHLFGAVYGLRRGSRVRLVNRTTQLVIEGYPRSGNTFAVVAFRQAQRDNVRLAHHHHAPAQIIRAARWGVPAIVLIREPADVVLSQVVRQPRIPVHHALRTYISFYEAVAEYRGAYAVGTFREVTRDYGAVIRRVNAKFGTDFSVFEHTEANVEKAFAVVEYLNQLNARGYENKVSRPSATKDRLKSEARSALETETARSLLAAAERIHYDFVSQASE